LRGHWWATVLNPSRLPHAYYYYLRKLNDKAGRPELVEYVNAFFPRLSRWLSRNENVLAHGERL
jgi:hypothetical protein